MDFQSYVEVSEVIEGVLNLLIDRTKLKKEIIQAIVKSGKGKQESLSNVDIKEVAALINPLDILSGRVCLKDEKLLSVTDTFQASMLKKLKQKEEAGYTGWDDPDLRLDLEEKLLQNLLDKDYIDVANLCAMLRYLKYMEEEEEKTDKLKEGDK